MLEELICPNCEESLQTIITKAKQIEKELKKHKLLFECAQDPVLYVTGKDIIIDANESAYRLYQYTRDELMNMSIHDIRHISLREEFEGQMEQADKTGIVFESIHRKKDGTNVSVEVSAKGTMIENERVRIHIIRDITERKIAEQKIWNLANYDSLTGIANREHLMNELDKNIERANREESKIAVMFFDIDKFKVINDLYGHDAGDTVLKTVTSRVERNIRKIDVFGRLGGDEFIIIQPLVKKDSDILPLINRIFKAIEEPISIGGAELKINISIGVSLYPDNGIDKDSLINSADNAMYEAKKEQGNTYRICEVYKV